MLASHPKNAWLACMFDKMAEKSQDGNPDKDWYIDQIASLKSAPNLSPKLVETVYRAICLAFPKTSWRLVYATESLMEDYSTQKDEKFEAFLVIGLLMAATETTKAGDEESISLENMKSFLEQLFRRFQPPSSVNPETISMVRGGLSNAITAFVDWSELDYKGLESLLASLRFKTTKRKSPLGQVHMCILDSLFYRSVAMLSVPEKLSLLLGRQQG